MKMVRVEACGFHFKELLSQADEAKKLVEQQQWEALALMSELIGKNGTAEDYE